MDVELQAKMQGHENNNSDIVDGADRTSYENNNFSLASKGETKKEVSMLFRIIVYLGPVFLSLLCYAVFTAKKWI